MGLTANEVKDWAHTAVSMIPHVEWFHGWELTYRTNALSLVKEDVVIVLSESIMKFCRVTSSTKPSEARRRIEEHMAIGFDGSDMLINIDGGEGSGLHTYTVPLRCWVDKEDETRVASTSSTRSRRTTPTKAQNSSESSASSTVNGRGRTGFPLRPITSIQEQRS